MITLTRRRLMGTAAVAAAGLPRLVPAARAAGDATAAIDEALRGSAEAGRVPGVVAVAAGGKGRIYEGAFGRRSIGNGAPMTPDTVFWIASMTKAVTSTAAMQMVEQGRLSLDAPISDVLPELTTPQVLRGFEDDGTPRLRAAKRPITLRHLLTHTSGFGYDTWNADIGRYEKAADIPPLVTCRNAALATPLTFDPGDDWQYGIGIDWAGKAVEKASGQRLDAYFRDHIFRPLGMADTGFRLTDSQRARLSAMHARQPDGSLKAMAFEMPQEPESFMGGGLYSTAPDYLRFATVFLGDGAPILRPETLALMVQNQMGATDVHGLKSVDPASSKDAEFFPGMAKKWGLGFMINTEDAPTGRSAGSLAWAGLGNTYFWIDRRRDVAGVIMTQLLPFADDEALRLLDAFERGTYRAVQAA